MTQRIYYSSDVLTHTARITCVTSDGVNAQIELDETVFAPKGGGQQCDLGDIDGWPVMDVRNGAMDAIHHILPGDAANVEISAKLAENTVKQTHVVRLLKIKDAHSCEIKPIRAKDIRPLSPPGNLRAIRADCLAPHPGVVPGHAPAIRPC